MNNQRINHSTDLQSTYLSAECMGLGELIPIFEMGKFIFI